MKVDLFEIIFDPKEIYSELSEKACREFEECDIINVELKEIISSPGFRLSIKELWEAEMKLEALKIDTPKDLLLIGIKTLDDLIDDWWELKANEFRDRGFM